MNKLYLMLLFIFSIIGSAFPNNNLYQETILAEECESDVSRLFPDTGSVDTYYRNMLPVGTPTNGSMTPSASQIVTEYNSSPVVGYKDLNRTYTYNDLNGDQKSLQLVLRIHEIIGAGTSREIIVSPRDAPFVAVDSLGGEPNLEGSWNKLPDGIFDPAKDPSGVYTYVVPGGYCKNTAYLVIIVKDNEGELGVEKYSQYNGFNTSNENFVYTRSPSVPVDNSSEIEKENELMEQITYFDGLGRPKQSIGIRAGGDLEDLVTPVEYDSYGRQEKEYLPFAATSQQGQIYADPITDVTNFYNTKKYENTTNPYSRKKLEASPLNRVMAQAAPGNPWALGSGHEIEFSFEANGSNEVRMLSVSFTNGDYRGPALSDEGYYSAGTLYKTVTYDEEHDPGNKNHSTEEFKDKQGRVVLKRTYADIAGQTEVAHDTYYVYDDYGNLTYVLPPKMDATNSQITSLLSDLDALGYQYEYDHRNRLVDKQIPGKGREYIVYNQLDQPILTQDALQRESKIWLYTKYDALGRVISTGKYSESNDYDQLGMQGVVTAFYQDSGKKPFEEKSGQVYTNRSFPDVNTTVLTENYYDNYNFDKSGIAIPGSNMYSIEIEASNLQGLATGSRVKVLGEDVWITTVSGYDDKGRLIWNSVKNDFLETTDVLESELDFVGNTMRQTTTHQKSNMAEDIITEDIFTYDHMNRMLSHQQIINDGPKELIAQNEYDDLGQLIKKGVGTGSESVESEDDFQVTTYTGLVNAIINEDGSIAKTGSGKEEGFVETEQEFSQDGYVEFTPSSTDRLFMVGLTYKDPDYPESDFTYYAYVVRDYIRTYEGGSRGWSSPYTKTPVAPGDIITVERIGYKVYYKKNGETFYISPYISAGKLKGKVLLSAAGTNGTSVGYVELHKLVRKPGSLQEVNYAYNIRGWLKQINNPDSLGDDMFGFEICYNDPRLAGTTALFNGNISETHWKSQSENLTGNPVSENYRYSYDSLNRIESATDNTGNYNLSEITYDKMGNILSLQRQGQLDAAVTGFGTMDNLNYSYNSGNQLQQVDDLSYNLEGFKDGNQGTDYAYDTNGNLISDANKGITAVEYNHLNMPTKITVTGANAGVLDYTYSANGIKLQKKKTQGGVITTTDYSGNYVYENNVLKQITQPEGYIEPDGSSFQYVYQLKDNWNNTRITFADDNNDGTVTSSEIRREQNFYPFGLEHQGYNGSSYGVENNLKTYQGQEFTEDLDLNVHEWKYRISDPAIGRFWQIDPLAEKYSYNSTYAFAENKLGLGIELEGLEVMVQTPPFGPNMTAESNARYMEATRISSTVQSVGMLAMAAPVVVSAVGTEATVTFVANEVKDEILSRATNGASDILDVTKMAYKGLKNLAEFGFKKLFGKADNIVKSFDDITEGAVKERTTKGNTDIFRKENGNFDTANNDFDNLELDDVFDLKNKDGDVIGRQGVNSDGNIVKVRTNSSDGTPTIETGKINSKGKYVKKTEIRYGESD